MKNLYGLLIAGALGAAAFVLNWMYLEQRGRERELVEFVALSKDVDSLEPGDRLRLEHLAPVPIPRNSVGNLPNSGFLWEARETLVNTRINQQLIGGQLIFRNYVETPQTHGPPLAEDEFTLPVPVDTRTFVSRWYKAGDKVWFGVERSALLPARAGDIGDASGGEEPPAGTTDIIGGDSGFVVWAVGDRVSSQKVAQSVRDRGTQQNVLHVIVRMENGKFVDPKDQRLADIVTGASQPRLIVLAQPPGE